MSCSVILLPDLRIGFTNNNGLTDWSEPDCDVILDSGNDNFRSAGLGRRRPVDGEVVLLAAQRADEALSIEFKKDSSFIGN